MIIAYRGEHGPLTENIFRTKLPSLSFGSLEAAKIYATLPNDRRMTPVASRVIKAELKIANPCINQTLDSFIDLSVIRDTLGHSWVERILTEFSMELKDTNVFEEMSVELGIDTVEELAAKHSECVDDLCIMVYHLLDNPKFIKAMKDHGYDGAIFGGSGANAGEVEYRVFDHSQARAIDVTII